MTSVGNIRSPALNSIPNIAVRKENKDESLRSNILLAQNNTPASASAGKVLGKIGEILVPDAMVFGETHSVDSIGGRGGNFALINALTGTNTYFGAKPISPLPLPGGLDNLASNPFLRKFAMKGMVPAFSVVGTNNGKGDEAGLGLSWKIPTPAGDLLAFANVRNDGITGGNIVDILRSKGQTNFKVSVNLGVCYSVSDGAAIGIGAVAGGPVGAAFGRVTSEELPDAWAGFAYRASFNFEKGKFKSVTISGVDIPIDKLGEILARNVATQRKSPPLIPNQGLSKIASTNDNIQLIYGQSPWDVGHSAKVRTRRGEVKIMNGTVDVHNHGNIVTKISEPVYELGVKYGLLKPNQKIANNKQAGQVIDKVLSSASKLDEAEKADGKPFQNHYGKAVERLRNPYGLDFGSMALKVWNQGYKKDLEAVGYRVPKNDMTFVKAAFQGEMRFPKDNPAQPVAPKPYGF